ncbi:class I SAM-dependent methyltransferase [Hyphomicrobium sp.]|uniref:class I SAM-dependent methyltransferase n=1 Tax=Hyphomicrobium sp. TaxID=82 RepID=UPI002E3120A3|nr:class I SAM-dependent methyltransferase [Hyphomicrobium sp.]HEX2842928.1 class I SAM-dependent methyltransferase [Hyphomicrobium sp.]
MTSPSWTSGYVAELDYTHGYYREMCPRNLELAMLSRQQAHSVNRPLRYLELGFGQGLSLNIHAAANEGEFWGTDFNPTQAANARELAAASGANLKAFDQSFAEFAARDDLPEFDIIVLHGIWSWISDENRRVIVDIARNKLKVGGLFYVSYNTTPGWSPAMPLRHLMSLHVNLATGEANGLGSRIDAALDFAERVIDSNALYFRANPAVAERLKSMKSHNRNYLAHEFFNADWHPMPFSEVAQHLEHAKLSFAASSNLVAHIDALHLTAQQQQLLASISHPLLRESVRDYCENQQFRRDVFVKGPRGLTPQRQLETLKSQRFMLLVPESEITFKLTGPVGEAQLQTEVYGPVVAALAEGRYAPKGFTELLANPLLKAVAPAQLAQALFVLSGLGHASAAHDEREISAVRGRAQALNRHIIERAVLGGELGFLASSVTGAGVHLGRIQQLFLRSLARGKRTPQEWAVDIWPIMEAQNQRLIRDGKSIATAAENISELATLGQDFAGKRLPILEAAGVTLPVSAEGGVAPNLSIAAA